VDHVFDNEDCFTGGLIWVQEWDGLQVGVNSALLALFYSDYLATAKVSSISCSGDNFSPQDIRSFAALQVCAVLMLFSHLKDD
jgi:hypothetical protein